MLKSAALVRPTLKNLFSCCPFKRLTITLFLLASPVYAQSAPAENPEQSQDEQKTLNEVIIQGEQFDKAQPLPKGDAVISPEIITRVNGQGGRPILHAYYELVFDPVYVNRNGDLTPDPDPRRKREVLRPQMRQKRAPTGSNIKRIPPSFYKLTLEEGFYALTQVRYRVQTRTTIINPDDPPAVSAFEVESSLDDIQYCLAEGTLVLDVAADTTATFGKLILRGLGRDKDAFPNHYPVVATDAPTTRPADGRVFAKDPDPVSWGVGRFDPDSGLCPRGKHFVTSGWPISENWTW